MKYSFLLTFLLVISFNTNLKSNTLQSETQNVIAVLDIHPQDIPIGEAAVITELLRNELVKIGLYKIVEKQRMVEIIGEIGFQQQGFTREGAVELGQMLNVQKLFTGTLGEIDGIRFLTVRIIDIETGQIEASATEKGFTAAYVDIAVKRIVYKIHDLSLPGGLKSPWEEDPASAVRYYMVYSGLNVSNILNFQAKSAFESGPAGQGIPIWSGEAAEVKSQLSFPGLGIKLGAWRKWYGGDLEISLLGHNTPKQDVFYDINGYVYVPEIKDFYAVKLDTLPVPEKFLKFYSLGFGLNFYVHLPAKKIQPYVGLGGSLLMNRAQSDFPGPGNHALKIPGKNLNSTSLGWGVQIPIGIKIPVSNSMFVYLEFRASRNYFSYVSGDGFSKERDRFTLQTFQFLIGMGQMFR